ncbi:MAG: OmpH family outer membrane protein [Verrucomicrobia bacterium]|nr:OmpH family outer membrane protein [Verrucomicrobiota bacterium]
MKLHKFALSMAVVMLATFSASAQQKIAVVDLQKVFDGYFKTREADRLLKEQGKEFESTLKNMLSEREAKLAEVEDASKQSNNPALSDFERNRLSTQADTKLTELRKMEQNIQSYDQTAKRTLAERQLSARENIIQELSSVIASLARTRGYDLVLDSVARSKNDTPIILFSSGKDDLTEEVIRMANQSQSSTLPSTPGTSGLGFQPGR